MPDSEAVNLHDMSEVFSFVFKENRWGNDESVSGAGSALASPSVRDAVFYLDEAIREFSIKSIADVPCGDFYWIPIILGRFPDVDYCGYDIVPALIEWNRQRYPGRSFHIADATQEVLPQADMIFCKDLLLHLKSVYVARLLRGFKLSKSRFLMISSNKGSSNQELNLAEPGACRDVNLEAAPYNFPAPIRSSNYLSLWSLDAIPMAFFDDLCSRLS